ncbi:MAG: MoaD/ThiS family protein [archaeon]
MRVLVESRDFKRTVTLANGANIEKLFQKMKLRNNDFVATLNGEIVLRDEPLKNGDKIKLYCAVGGG